MGEHWPRDCEGNKAAHGPRFICSALFENAVQVRNRSERKTNDNGDEGEWKVGACQSVCDANDAES